MVETRLQLALRHVESARDIVAAQAALVDRLQAAGKDATDASSLLAAFERTLASFEDDLRGAQQEEAAPSGTHATIRGRWPEP